MQHDVFANPGPRTRTTGPYIAVLQADVVGGTARLVCPLFRAALLASSRTMPLVTLFDEVFVLAIPALCSVHVRALRAPVGSVAFYRDEIVRALDWLFTGI